MIRFFCSTLILLISTTLLSQPIENDACENAITILPGQTIANINNELATVSDLETPEPEPTTCIKTFENDLWYVFTTSEEYTYYQIEISPLACNTPAGLQAMIIQTDECESSRFIYKACANPYAEVKLEMTITDTVPGNRYLIYIDGYDGTECVFNLTLTGANDNPQTGEEIRMQQNDYGTPPPLFEPDDYTVDFLNNEATITWSVPTTEDVEVFLVQRYIQTSFSSYGRGIGSVEPVSVVATNENPVYIFVDQKRFIQNADYCYRIVKVASDGSKSYSEPICTKADLVEDFFISPVYGQGEGIYFIKFRNFKKQNLTFIVQDKNFAELKRLVRKNEPKQDGTINIDMSPYEPGVYHLRVESKKEFFLRRFIVE